MPPACCLPPASTGRASKTPAPGSAPVSSCKPLQEVLCLSHTNTSQVHTPTGEAGTPTTQREADRAAQSTASRGPLLRAKPHLPPTPLSPHLEVAVQSGAGRSCARHQGPLGVPGGWWLLGDKEAQRPQADVGSGHWKLFQLLPSKGLRFQKNHCGSFATGRPRGLLGSRWAHSPGVAGAAAQSARECGAMRLLLSHSLPQSCHGASLL